MGALIHRRSDIQLGAKSKHSKTGRRLKFMGAESHQRSSLTFGLVHASFLLYFGSYYSIWE